MNIVQVAYKQRFAEAADAQRSDSYYAAQPRALDVRQMAGKRVHNVAGRLLTHPDYYGADLGSYPRKAAACMEGVARSVLQVLLGAAGLPANCLDDIMGSRRHMDSDPQRSGWEGPAPPSELQVSQYNGPAAGAHVRTAAFRRMDQGLMTVIAEDAPGLEVQDVHGNWTKVNLQQGQVAVVAGHTLNVALGGIVPAGLHRVVVSKVRWSMAFKLRAYADAIIDLRETLDNAGLPLCDESSQPIKVGRLLAEHAFASQAYACQEQLGELRAAVGDDGSGGGGSGTGSAAHFGGPLAWRGADPEAAAQSWTPWVDEPKKPSPNPGGKSGADKTVETFLNENVFVRTLTGKTIAIKVSGHTTIWHCKRLIQDLEGIPMDQQRLIGAGKQMEDSHVLAFYGIGAGDTIHLVLRLQA